MRPNSSLTRRASLAAPRRINSMALSLTAFPAPSDVHIASKAEMTSWFHDIAEVVDLPFDFSPLPLDYAGCLT